MATTHGAPPNWAVDILREAWALIAEKRGVLSARRLLRVCRASRAGGGDCLSILPGLVVCGGTTSGGERVSDVLRLDLATLRWERMPALATGRVGHACCAVRGAPVVLGGHVPAVHSTSSVEMLSSEGGAPGAFVDLPPLSSGGIYGVPAIAVEETDSAAGQVLLLGGTNCSSGLSTVQLVDLATGACAPQPGLLYHSSERMYLAAGRLPDGRIVCAGGTGGNSSAEVWGAPEQGAADASWTWRELPALSTARYGCCGCVMSDGRFAVLGGRRMSAPMSSCEALVVDGDAHWNALPPMHDARNFFACGAFPGCVIVAGGDELKSAEV
jgi:hypothetical protein